VFRCHGIEQCYEINEFCPAGWRFVVSTRWCHEATSGLGLRGWLEALLLFDDGPHDRVKIFVDNVAYVVVNLIVFFFSTFPAHPNLVKLVKELTQGLIAQV